MFELGSLSVLSTDALSTLNFGLSVSLFALINLAGFSDPNNLFRVAISAGGFNEPVIRV